MSDGAERAGYLIQCDRTLGLLLLWCCCKVSKVPGGLEPQNIVDMELYYCIRLSVFVKNLGILRMLLDIMLVLYTSETVRK